MNGVTLKNNYQEITSTVTSKLETTKQNKEKSCIATANLKRHYEKTLSSSEFFEEKPLEHIEVIPLKDSVYADSSQDKPSPIEVKAKSSQEIISELPEYVKPGVWFKIYTGEDTPPRRLKLSIITIEDARLIFVDRKGTMVIEKDALKFNYEILNNQSQILEDHSVFDHALSQVISNISKKANR